MKKRTFLSLLLTLVCGMQIQMTAAETNVVAEEGAWCWFADPRALHYENAGGTINATYIGYIDVHGNVKATQYDWLTGVKSDVLIRSYFQPDDHNNPTFIVLPDERVMIFYTRHTDEPCIWYRVSEKKGDITALGEEKRLATANNTTYPSPFILSDDPNHIYLCWRGINWHPTIARLTMPDANGDCAFDFGPKQIVQSTGARPYAKYQSNGKDKIYVSYTTGHPDNEMPDWLYFNVIDINNGNGPILRDLNGTQLSVIADGVFNVSKTDSYASSYPATIVDRTSGVRNWVWQIALDSEERPVVAYPHIDNAKTSHTYYYGRWNGSAWKTTQVAQGGHAFHQNWNSTERCYSGGMAIDPDNVNDLYLSIPTSGGAFSTDGTYEIWKYTVSDAGVVTGSEQITTNSPKNNARPFIIPGSKSSPMRLTWMQGDYYYWIVTTYYPKGFPTAIHYDYAWSETERDMMTLTTDDKTLSEGKTLNVMLAMNTDKYYGTLLASEDGAFVYSLDATTHYPQLIIGGNTYTSQNRLYTSDDWSTMSTGTSGDNHPTKLTTWVLTLTYDGQTLTTYRNGLIDQKIDVSGLNVEGIAAEGDGFNHSCLGLDAFSVAATPKEVQQVVAEALDVMEAQVDEIALDMLSVPEETRTDLVLPTEVLGKSVSWSSSNARVITAGGILVPRESDATVTLTATVGTQSKDFTVKALARDITKNVRYELEGLDLTANTAAGFSTNTYGLAPEGLLERLRSFTFLVTIKAGSLTKMPRIYDFGSASGNSVFLRANPLAAGVKYNGGTTTMVNGATTLQTAKEYKLAVSYEASTKTTRIYVDGVEDASGTVNQVEPYQLYQLAADSRNYIGRTQWWDSGVAADNVDFVGTISDFRLYDVMLTQEEICNIQDLPFEQEDLPSALSNGDFEGSYTVQSGSGVVSDRAIYVPEGWTVERSDPNENDITALKTGDLYYSNFFASYPASTEGSTQSYWIRQNWGTPTLTLSQKLRLPSGKYTLTASLWKSGLGGDAFVKVATEGGAVVQNASLENKEAWQPVELEFESDGRAATTISLIAQHTSSGSVKIIGFDNVVLTHTGGDEPEVQEYEFRLKNVLGFDRSGETVEISVPEGMNLSLFALQDEQGATVPFEVTDEGKARFQATVGRGATAGYHFVPGTPTLPSTLTYAAVKDESTRADMAWENDLCAYRMYSSVLLSRESNTAQGVDVWQKKQSSPVIDQMYQLSNYHNENQYGVDAYSVNGKRLGCGGTAAVVDGHLQMHDPYSTCRQDERGALAQDFTLTYDDVEVDGDAYTKTLRVQTTAGALLNKATLRMEGPEKNIRIAVAIYQHTDMSINVAGTDFTDVEGVIGRAEANSEGSITSTGARFYQGAYVPGQNVTTEVIDNHLCLVVDYTPGTDLVFYFGGGWNIFPEGRYGSDADWFAALEEFKQTVENPLTGTGFHNLPVKDDVLHVLNTVNETWQQRNPTHGNYFWNRAVYHIGNMAAYKATERQDYLDFSTAWAQQNNYWGAPGTDKTQWIYDHYGEGGNFVLFGDNQVCFQVYADLYNLEEEKDEQKIARAKEVMEYEVSTSNVDYLYWVDGLFMVMPVMTKLYGITENGQFLDKMYRYWRYGTDLMCDKSGDEATGLYYRDANYVYPAHTTGNGKKDFWARGDGWMFAAFATVLSELPEDDSHRAEYISYYQRMAQSIKECQQDEGYWTRSMIDPSYAPGYETSGTALFAYGYAWGINNGILSEEEYGETLEKAWEYLTGTALQSDGTVGYIQPIGERADPNQTLTAQNYYDFGVGAYLLAAAEMSRLAIGDLELPKLRVSSARMDDANVVTVTFNSAANAEEAVETEHYKIDGNDIVVSTIEMMDESTVTITLGSPLDYGRYTLTVEGIHSAEGGEMAEGQVRTLLLTVPLSPVQDGVTVTAIGAQSGNPAANAIDNDLGTRWSQQGEAQWLQVDLGSVQAVEAVDVAFYQGAARVAYFDVQISQDGTVFSTVLSEQQSSGMTEEIERYRLPETTEARYVRVVCNGTTAGDWNSITEVRVRVRENSLSVVTLPEEIWGDILLPVTTESGSTIVWTSSDRNVLTGTGLATLGNSDTEVTLTAMVGTASRDFNITVKARSLEANTQLHYSFEDEDLYTESGQQMVRDRSGRGRDARLMGSVGSVTNGKLDMRQNTATGFSQNAYLVAPSHVLDSLRSYTMMMVATPQELSKQFRLYDFGSASGNSMFLRCATTAVGLKYNNGTTTLINATKQVTTGETQQIAVVFDAKSKTTTLWIDGVQAVSTTAITREPYELTLVASDARNYIGRTQWWDSNVAADNQDFIGEIDEVRLYSLALTEEELTQVFSGMDTGITIIDQRQDEGDTPVYDLMGRRLARKPVSGIYIQNGKKYIGH